VRDYVRCRPLGVGNDKEFSNIKSKATDLKKLIIEASTGTIPENKSDADRSEKKSLRSHSRKWFKSVEGGEELCSKVFEFGLWLNLKSNPSFHKCHTACNRIPKIEKLL